MGTAGGKAAGGGEMKTRTAVATMVLGVFCTRTEGQVISVRCCIEQPDLERIGECVSGPGDTSLPSSCPPAATCALGFGSNADLMESLCDPAQSAQPVPVRGYCSEWSDDNSVAVHECTAGLNPSINLFAVFDDEQDGDLDLGDLAVFHQVYDSTPKLEQSDAVLVYLECCVPQAVVKAIGNCLSGPGETALPGTCNAAANCIAGFSAPVEVGDWLNRLCASGPIVPPDPSNSYCSSWQSEEIPTVYLCPGSHISGLAMFVVSDSDGDGDVDLRDFAVLQREFEPPTD